MRDLGTFDRVVSWLARVRKGMKEILWRLRGNRPSLPK